MPVSKHSPPKNKPISVSHRAHLEPSFHKKYTKVTNDFQIVLFHYVTRSQNSFVERKINRRSGVYATTYSELREKDKKAGAFLSAFLDFPHMCVLVCWPSNMPLFLFILELGKYKYWKCALLKDHFLMVVLLSGSSILVLHAFAGSFARHVILSFKGATLEFILSMSCSPPYRFIDVLINGKWS